MQSMLKEDRTAAHLQLLDEWRNLAALPTPAECMQPKFQRLHDLLLILPGRPFPKTSQMHAKMDNTGTLKQAW